MKYNLSEIMHKAWKLYRKGVSSFAEALHRAWNSAKAAPVNAQRIEEAQQTAGITEPVNTWVGWKAAGYMVEHSPLLDKPTGLLNILDMNEMTVVSPFPMNPSSVLEWLDNNTPAEDKTGNIA